MINNDIEIPELKPNEYGVLPKERKSLNPLNWLSGYMYPVNVIVHIPRSSGQEIFFDRARRIKDKKSQKERYYFKKMKCNTKPAVFKNMIRTNKGLFV
mgnify:CR=1 FL=1